MASLLLRSSLKFGGYTAYVVASRTIDGKQIRRIIDNLGHFPDKRAALREFYRRRHQYHLAAAREAWVEKEKRNHAPTLSELAPEYIRTWTKSKAGLARATISLAQLLKRLGNIRATDLSPVLVQRYVADRLEDYQKRENGPLGRRTINLEINTLASLMTWSLRRGTITKHPFRDDMHPIASYHLKVADKTPTVLTNEEIRLILEALQSKPHCLTVFLGYILTGMRKSELPRLTWDQVDFESGVIRFTTPKTGKERVIPLAPQYLALLRRMKVEWPGNRFWHTRKPCQMSYVYCTATGAPFTWNVGHFIPRLAKRLGLRHIHLHALRHTFATRLASFVSAFELQRALGHETLRMTQRYVNMGVTETMQRGLRQMEQSIGFGQHSSESRE